MRLLALSASQTATLAFADVQVPRRYLLARTVENVMRVKGGGAGSLTTSALALGVTRGVLGAVTPRERTPRRPRPDPRGTHGRIQRGRLGFIRGRREQRKRAVPTAESVRQKANSLVLRAAQAYLAASKGAGFVMRPPRRAGRSRSHVLSGLVLSTAGRLGRPAGIRLCDRR